MLSVQIYDQLGLTKHHAVPVNQIPPYYSIKSISPRRSWCYVCAPPAELSCFMDGWGDEGVESLILLFVILTFLLHSMFGWLSLALTFGSWWRVMR